MIIFTPRINML